MGPPALICLANSGTTEPEELSTFANLTAENEIFFFCMFDFNEKYFIANSDNLLVAPITLDGLTALSEDININLDIL